MFRFRQQTLREGQQYVQGHTAGKSRSPGENPGLSHSAPVLLATVHPIAGGGLAQSEPD